MSLTVSSSLAFFGRAIFSKARENRGVKKTSTKSEILYLADFFWLSVKCLDAVHTYQLQQLRITTNIFYNFSVSVYGKEGFLIKEKNPELTYDKITKILSRMWRSLSEEEKNEWYKS